MLSEYQHLSDLVSRKSFEVNWFNFVENSDLWHFYIFLYFTFLYYIEYQSYCVCLLMRDLWICAVNIFKSYKH